MSNSKSAQISALVAQLKAGLINKQELFESLNRLQHGDVPTEPKPNPASAPETAAVPPVTQPAPPPSLPPSAAPTATQPSQAPQFLQQPDMAAAFQAALAAMSAVAPPVGTNNLGAMQQRALMAAALALEAQRHGYSLPLPGSLFSSGVETQGSSSFIAPPPPQPRPESTGSVWATLSQQQPINARLSATPLSSTHRRTRAQLAASSRSQSVSGKSRESLGVTGRPIAPPVTPGSYVDPAAFQERVLKWAMERREEMLRKAAEERAKSQAECTFRPEINEESRKKAEASRRFSSRDSEIHERLYQQARAKSLSRTPATPSAGAHLSSGGPPDSPGDEECTFAPSLDKSRATFDAAHPVRARYMDPVPPRSERKTAGAAPTAGQSECTFAPRTNAIKPAQMPAAAMYIRADIYDRLSKTNTKAQVEREKQVNADLQRIEQQHREKLGVVAPPLEGEMSANPVKGLGDMTEEEKLRLDEFLLRQNAAAERKKKKMDELRTATAPIGQPSLCLKSLKIVQASSGGVGFLERLQRTNFEKQEDASREKAKLTLDPECTFVPAINPASKALRRRSFVDMSRGDALKRETATRLLRLRLEQEGLEGVTFRPMINDMKHVEGRLKVLSEPETYVARLSAEAASQAEKARRAVSSAEVNELSECTFTPKVNDAPDYIKRIARHMALTRAVKAPEPANSKPEWR